MWKRNRNADINGISLQLYCETLTLSKVRQVFGKPDPDGYVDDEKGYDGNEYRFVSEIGDVVNLYSRFGNWRIGAHSPEVAERFKFWLTAWIV